MNTFLCKECRNIFSQPSGGDFAPRCPKCGSPGVMEAPAWSPLGSGANIFEDSTWKYECQECRLTFTLPIPRSPSEEKQRKCIYCGAGHLHLLTAVGAQPLYCG
jgi:DNA-directed RNA polymerase subunit RPC12/RpoP